MALSSDSINLLFKAKGDTDDAKRAFKELRTEIGKVDTEAKKAGTGGGTELTASLAPSKLGGITAGLSAVTLGITAVAGVLATAAGIAGGLTKLLFDLAKEASDYGSAIYDASEKTGLGAETLSALKYAADQSGSSLENVAGSVQKFSVLVGEAQKGSKAAQETLKAYGVTARNLDQALAQAIKAILAEKDATTQAAAAKALFKDRTGEILPVLKSFDGDLPGLIEKLRTMGVLLTDSDAVAADDFGDSLNDLKFQAAAVGRQFAFNFMPDITRAMKEISAWFSSNKDTVRSWATSFGDALRGVLVAIKELVSFYNEHETALRVMIGLSTLGASEGVRGFIGTLKQVGEQSRLAQNALDQQNAWDPTRRGKPSSNPADFNIDPAESERAAAEAKAAADKRRAEREAAYRRELASYKESLKLRMEATKADLEESNQTWEDAFLSRSATEKEFQKNSLGNLDQYVKNVKKILDEQFTADIEGKTESEIRNLTAARQMAERNLQKDVERHRADIAKTIADFDKKDAEAAARQNAELLEQQKQADTESLALLDSLHRQGLLKETEYISAVSKIKREALEAQRAIEDDPSRRAALDSQLRILASQVTADMAEARQREAEEVQNAADAYDRYREKLWAAQMAAAETWAEIANAGPSVFDTWIQSLDNFVGALRDAVGESTGPIDMLTNAFMNVTRAIGQTIQQYLLYGSTGPAVMRKILASALASIAAEAAVRAIYAAALGFFFLAIGAYTDATNAFIAAAIWGTIAVGTGLAARAVAGNAFQQQTSGAYGSSSVSSGQGSGNGGTVYSSRSDQIVDVSRNAPVERGSSLRLDVGIKLDSNGVLDVIRDSVRSNGIMRQLIVDTV